MLKSALITPPFHGATTLLQETCCFSIMRGMFNSIFSCLKTTKWDNQINRIIVMLFTISKNGIRISNANSLQSYRPSFSFCHSWEDTDLQYADQNALKGILDIVDSTSQKHDSTFVNPKFRFEVVHQKGIKPLASEALLQVATNRENNSALKNDSPLYAIDTLNPADISTITKDAPFSQIIQHQFYSKFFELESAMHTLAGVATMWTFQLKAISTTLMA